MKMGNGSGSFSQFHFYFCVGIVIRMFLRPEHEISPAIKNENAKKGSTPFPFAFLFLHDYRYSDVLVARKRKHPSNYTWENESDPFPHFHFISVWLSLFGCSFGPNAKATRELKKCKWGPNLIHFPLAFLLLRGYRYSDVLWS